MTWPGPCEPQVDTGQASLGEAPGRFAGCGDRYVCCSGLRSDSFTGLSTKAATKMTRKSLAILLLMGGCSTAAEDGGPIEPGFGKSDGFSQIETSSIEFGGEVTGEFSEDFQFFAYEFDALADGVISAEVTQAGTARGLDTTLFVYRVHDADTPSRIGFDDDGGWGTLSRIEEFTLYTDDTYALVVGTKGATGRGAFRLTLECDNGACEPAPPPESACPSAMRAEIVDCIEEVSYEVFEYEGELSEAFSVCSDEDDAVFVAYEDLCLGGMAPSWCAPGTTLVDECTRLFESSYPSSAPVAARLQSFADESLGALETAAMSSPGCGNSSESGCLVEAYGHRYAGEPPTMPELLAHARSIFEVGPGILPEQTLTGESFDGFIMQYGVEAELNAALDALGVDPSAAEIGIASGDEFRWNHGDCTAIAVVAHDPSSRVVMTVLDLFCAG